MYTQFDVNTFQSTSVDPIFENFKLGGGAFYSPNNTIATRFNAVANITNNVSIRLDATYDFGKGLTVAAAQLTTNLRENISLNAGIQMNDYSHSGAPVVTVGMSLNL